MDSVQFEGFVTGCTQNLVAGTMTVNLEAKLKNVSEADREKLGLWAGLDDPKIDLVVENPQPSGLGVELEGELVSAKTNLATARLALGIKIKRSDVSKADEELLADLGRFIRPTLIEIKVSQMSF